MDSLYLFLPDYHFPVFDFASFVKRPPTCISFYAVKALVCTH